MDGSSQEDENLKSKMDGYRPKPTKWTDHPTRMKISSPKWTGINKIHKVDGASLEDENYNHVHKVDG